MKKTTNYQLNQWAKTDRIMMDDFNADNAIIDAALAGKVPMTLLYDVTGKEMGPRFDLDAAGQHWEKYIFVLLVYTPAPDASTAPLKISINNDAGKASHRDLLNQNTQEGQYLLDTNAYHGVTMLFFPHGNRRLQALCFNDGALFYSSSNYGYTQPISVTGGFKGGERLRVYGIL